jgi:hypothetical protein
MKRAYHSPPFRELPECENPLFRWVGSCLVTEEQYHMERWERTFVGPAAYWRASRDGLQAYLDLRGDLRDERKAAWQAREEEDESWREAVAR